MVETIKQQKEVGRPTGGLEWMEISSFKNGTLNEKN